MTDAALPVTQSAVEGFTRRYLESLGCSIDVRGEQWMVEVPRDADTELGERELTLLCSPDEAEVGENEHLLHPESPFFQTVVEEAARRTPVGSMALTADDVEIQLPGWATASDHEITDATFTAYYDRTAVTVLFRVSIETVSEYQTELLRAVSFDAHSNERLPELTGTYLDLTTVDRERLRDSNIELSGDKMTAHLEFAHEEIEETVQPEIDEIHGNASRAADVELEEYRQLQQQRIDELGDDLDSLTDRIDELSGRIQETSDQAERREALRKRKQLKGERDEFRRRVAEIREQREAGFPEKQREIRDRHGLEVHFEPVAITLIEYETGDLTLSLATESGDRTVTVGYGSGAGMTETLVCERCDHALTAENPVLVSSGEILCRSCEASTEAEV